LSLVERRLIRSAVSGLESCFKDSKMTKKDGLQPISRAPDWVSNRASEWDGNNRIYNLGKKYEKSFAMLTEGQPEENVKLYSDFLRRTKFEGISIVRQINYMRALKRLKAITKDLPLKGLSKCHTDAYLAQISDSSPGTRQILFYCLKKFLVFLRKAELLDGVKPAPARDLKVSAADLLTREDLARLLEACPTARGRAFIMTLYESGARIGELLNLRRSDVELDAYGVILNLDGKTGRRRVRLVESVAYLKRWLDEIRNDAPDAVYVWFGVSEKEPSQYAATAKFIKTTARKAGLRKKVYPHLFRHSRASELAQKLKESQLRAFMGWGAASDMPRIYIHLSAQDVDKAILDIYKEGRPCELDEMKKFYQVWQQMKTIC